MQSNKAGTGNDPEGVSVSENKKTISLAEKIANVVTNEDKEVLEYGKLRQLVDCGSSEWKGTSMDEKVKIYQHLFSDLKISEGSLLGAIEDYSEFYNSINKPHASEEIVESLLKTLKHITTEYTLIKK